MTILQIAPIIIGDSDEKDEDAPRYVVRDYDKPKEVPADKPFDINLELCCDGRESKYCPRADVTIMVREMNPIGDNIDWWDFPILNALSPVAWTYDEEQTFQLDDGECGIAKEVSQDINLNEQKPDRVRFKLYVDGEFIDKWMADVVTS